MRLLRPLLILVAVLAVLAVLIAVTIWATAPKAGGGRFLLRPKSDYTSGPWFAYVSPWGGESLLVMRPWSKIADGISLDLKRMPAETVFQWRWPPINPSFGPGVWGYNHVAYGNYDGGQTEVAVEPIRVRDVRQFRQSFDWSLDAEWGEANVLTEFYLRSDRDDVESRSLEVGWFLHLPDGTRPFFEGAKQVGTFVDPQGRSWRVRIADKFCMFALEDSGDLKKASLDMLASLRWLESRQLVAGEEWLWGVAIGVEPVSGIGEMTLHDWDVQRR